MVRLPQPLISKCNALNNYELYTTCYNQGRIQDFMLRGGALQKIAASGGRLEIFWGISCEKSILRKKNHIFSNFRGGGAAPPPPPPPPPPPLNI